MARTTRLCVYDRAGPGWSEPATTPQDGAQIATDLNTLLHRGGVPGPYLLAGHSVGGLYVLTFAARYPDEVTGLVLIDSTAPKPATTSEGGARLSALASASARLGLGVRRRHAVVGAEPFDEVTDIGVADAVAQRGHRQIRFGKQYPGLPHTPLGDPLLHTAAR